MDFDEIAADKAERQAALIEALTSTPADVDTSARQRLEQLLGPDALAELDQRVLALITGEGEPQPEPALLDSIETAQDDRRRNLLTALLGDGRTASPAEAATGGLDGGARQTPPPAPESHGEWLTRILAERSANVGHQL